MLVQHEDALALALEMLAQEIVEAMPAQSRPDELQAAINFAFDTLGLAAIQERTN